MAGIEVGNIDIIVTRGDMLNESFEVTNTDVNFVTQNEIVGKTFYCEVKKNMDDTPILVFKESDSSLVKTINGELVTVQLSKSASVIEALILGTYKLSIIMGTAPNYEDKETFIKGTFTVTEEITEKP